MSNSTRNRGFQRKSRKKQQNTDASGSPQRRSKGLREHQTVSQPKSPKSVTQNQRGPKQSGQSGRGREGGAGWIWGYHAVAAVLANPSRTIHKILATENSVSRIDVPDRAPAPQIVLPGLLDKEFGPGHQGLAVKAAPLEWPDMGALADGASDDGLILVLDQITDPHNAGAMLRLASAFGITAVVMQTRHAPPQHGALAKVAVGCLETVPVCLVTNIANALEDLKSRHWFVTGLAGDTDLTLQQALSPGGRRVIVMGAEGPGLRDRVRKTCDSVARIPMESSPVEGEAESLNVATAAAIALYEARRGS